MQVVEGNRRYSASDVVGFLECEHVTTLDMMDLAERLPRSKQDESDKLIQEKGIAHERAHLKRLRDSGVAVVHVGLAEQNLPAKAAQTVAAMKAGAAVIYQATLIDGDLLGFADFLIRVERPSLLGTHSYEVWDTKLSRSPKAKFVVQLSFYSALLAKAQGLMPDRMHLVLGDHNIRSYRLADYSRYFDSLMARFRVRVGGSREETYPHPCAYCDLCKWAHLCSEKWLADDHLSQVANVTRSQISKLQGAGIKTMSELALSTGKREQGLKINPDTFERLRAQAVLQVKARASGERFVEVLEPDAAGSRGFFRLPKPDAGDMFFDMEGSPWEDGGLEYLFGVYVRVGNDWEFKGFWAHSRAESGSHSSSSLIS